MEKKFTQGEWVFDKECEDVSSLDKSVEGNIICEAPVYWTESMKNWEANAKLIAAAPDLLECLLEAVESLELNESKRNKKWDNAIKKALE